MGPRAASRYDVAVLGGGPAGSAVALSLLRHAPEMRVVVVEGSAYESPRVGEALHPGVQPLLRHLGVWEAFHAAGHLPAHGTRSTWGGGQPFDNEFLFRPEGRGWHLDRRRFDALLAAEAARCGADLLTHAEAVGARQSDRGDWVLEVLSGDAALSPIEAGFVVDATGRAAAFASRRGARRVQVDRLVGVSVLLSLPEPASVDTYTLVEPVEEGWWYSALLPEGGLIVALMTDADLVQAHQLHTPAPWLEAARRAPLTFQRLCRGTPLGRPRVHPAASQRLDRVTGERWLATGDAASAFDPLSAQGIFKSLRSGIHASYSVLDWRDGRQSGLEKYERLVANEFDEYLTVRADYYAQERRWAHAPFWSRRAGGAGALR